MNGGKSPAIEVVAAGNTYSRSKDFTVEVSTTLELPADGKKDWSQATLGPGIPYTVFFESYAVFTTQGQVDAVLNGNNWLFTTGFIRYKDLLGNTHFTQFCFRIGGQDLGKLDTKEGFATMAACSSGNKST